ncbi:MAG TPA: TolC family protein [Spirochaetota bacterium]|jgi:outer membrane protein TolC|nr:TolC family protein [Spirochaetota bacterium]
MKIKFILPFLLFPVFLFGEEKKITLEQCIEVALQNHPSLFVAIEDDKKSIANYQIARSMRSIIVDGEIKTVEYTKSNSSADSRFSIPGEDTDIGLFAGLSLTYNLYNAKKDVVEEQARTSIDVAKVTNYQVKSKIIYEVKNAYYSYLLARDILAIREEIYNKYKSKAQLSRQLFEQGSRPILDVSKAEVDLANAQLQLEQAKNNERKMRQSLYYAMGLEENDQIDIIPENIDLEKLPEINCTLANLYRMCEVYNPELRIARLQKKIAQLKITEEAGSHYPTVDLLIGLGYENKKLYGMGNIGSNFEAGSWSPAFHGAIRASLPIYSGGRISARVDSATADYNKMIYKEKEILTDIKNQVRDNYRTLEEMKRQIEISELIIKNAQRHQLLAQRSYENGAGTLLELQDADLNVIQAKIGLLEARYNYLLNFAKLVDTVGFGEGILCRN